jgi:predicted signal transduction protein with EAL and GGDEF domain
MQTCGPEIPFARIGGDEFSILFDDLNDLNDAMIAGEAVTEHAPGSVYGFRPRIICYGQYRRRAQRAGVCRSRGDFATRRRGNVPGKETGQGRFEVFDRATSKRLERQSQIETDLSRAVERAELVLEYQPIVRLETGRIAGFEALLRWQHPTLGLISPPDFISVAEATGAIVPIGEWVLEEGCRQTREWQRAALRIHLCT